MRILEFKPSKNYVVLKVDNKLDLIFLKKIIEKGDLITSKTLRNIFLQREDRKEKIKKKLVTLTIKVEKAEFDKTRKKLRVKGKIVNGPKEISLGDYHTIEVDVGSKLTVEKEKWEENHIKNLEKAKAGMKFVKSKLIQEFLIHLNKEDGLAVYGLEQTKLAAEIGAVKVALIPEEMIGKKEIEDLMETVKNKGGEIGLISDKTKVGMKFNKMYKYGAILRFRIR